MDKGNSSTAHRVESQDQSYPISEKPMAEVMQLHMQDAVEQLSGALGGWRGHPSFSCPLITAYTCIQMYWTLWTKLVLLEIDIRHPLPVLTVGHHKELPH